MKRTIPMLLVLAAVAGPSFAQTFIRQVFPENDKLFVFEATGDAQVAINLMWNREPASLFAVMVCDAAGMAFDWGASAPQQDRTLRLDVGVAGDLFCAVSVSTDLVAAFAINLQSFQPSTLAKGQTPPIRLREPEAGDAATIERLRPQLDRAMHRLRRLAGAGVTAAEEATEAR